MSKEKPSNVFEQILFGLEAVNENVIAVDSKVEALLKIFSATEPVASGADDTNKEQK